MPDNDLEMFVIYFNTLQAVYLLYLINYIFLNLGWPLDCKNVGWSYRTVGKRYAGLYIIILLNQYLF